MVRITRGHFMRYEGGIPESTCRSESAARRWIHASGGMTGLDSVVPAGGGRTDTRRTTTYRGASQIPLALTSPKRKPGRSFWPTVSTRVPAGACLNLFRLVPVEHLAESDDRPTRVRPESDRSLI